MKKLLFAVAMIVSSAALCAMPPYDRCNGEQTAELPPCSYTNDEFPPCSLQIPPAG